jgi:predicted DNA-binding transcriptional regulator YafY
MHAVDTVLIDAIRTRHRVRFTYNGRTRRVEPQCYGIGARGAPLLRAHQLEGGVAREPLFDVSKIRDLLVLDEVFPKPGPNYTKNDSAMKTIFAQL